MFTYFLQFIVYLGTLLGIRCFISNLQIIFSLTSFKHLSKSLK